MTGAAVMMMRVFVAVMAIRATVLVLVARVGTTVWRHDVMSMR